MKYNGFTVGSGTPTKRFPTTTDDGDSTYSYNPTGRMSLVVFNRDTTDSIWVGPELTSSVYGGVEILPGEKLNIMLNKEELHLRTLSGSADVTILATYM